MLNLFKTDRIAKAYKAIQADNLDQLSALLDKIAADEINQPVSDTLPSLVEVCILEQSPKALRLVLQKGGCADQQALSNPALNLYSLALQMDNSLPLLGALLEKGQHYSSQTLLTESLDACPNNQLMLHISLLLQYGAEITEPVIHHAFQHDDFPLINFLFNSGAELPQDIDEKNYQAGTVSYAKRCVEDLKIRKMFLGSSN